MDNTTPQPPSTPTNPPSQPSPVPPAVTPSPPVAPAAPVPPPTIATPPQQPPHSRKTVLTVLIALLFVCLIGVGVAIFLQSTSTANESQVVPTQAPVAAPTPTPSDQVSSDDSVETIDKEVDATKINDFSEDSQKIEDEASSL